LLTYDELEHDMVSAQAVACEEGLDNMYITHLLRAARCFAFPARSQMCRFMCNEHSPSLIVH